VTTAAEIICESLERSQRSRDAQRETGLSRRQFAATLHKLERAGRVSWTPDGWAVAPRRRTRRSLGVIS
jgi:DNA-binding HxlR family transcriptional regulator